MIPPHLGPPHPSDRDFRVGMRLSIVAHLLVLLIVVMKSLVFPGQPKPLIPSLRVDLVGLPDMLKKDKFKLPRPSNPTELAEELKKAEASAKKMTKTSPLVEPAKPDEMVVKPKPETQQKKSDAREKKLKGALARIKALEKLSSDDSKPSVVVKGNKISKGGSLSEDARESDEASYYDLLKDRLQENWALPPWLARQNLAARVEVFIDAKGKLKNFRFLRGSGNAQFDEAIKNALTASQPFPAPPDNLAAGLLSDGISVGFPL